MNKGTQVHKVIDKVPGRSLPVAEVSADALSPELFWEKHVRRHAPVLVRGAAKHWPAMELWRQPEYLLDSTRTPESSRCPGTIGTFNAIPHPAGYFKKTSLANCLKNVTDSDQSETVSIPFFKVPDEWRQDIGELGFIDIKSQREPRMYPALRAFAYRNGSTDWHRHPTDETITVQIAGRKKFSLFRLGPEASSVAHCIKYNLHHLVEGPSYFPVDQPITKYEGTVGPGDAIYVPPFWYHGVDSADSELGITLAFCFATPIGRFGSFKESGQNSLRWLLLGEGRTKLGTRLARAAKDAGLVTLSELSRIVGNEEWITRDEH